ncbi:DNA polymerase III subunit alpha [uncultured Mailhella sp.]|uniref:DNA polymerase III subunit alpha n=1 Tax=uncultured Mailhella sp. TaxID=1981031 RepID=UPI002635BCC7|nr:DNA polymerase III subunit alpha [uncultured Mailhella sp.]
MSDFVHLHCHTEFSLLDGAIRVGEAAKKAHALGMPATAITDHGNLFGAAYFYTACKEAEVQPIIGCEVYVTRDHTDKTTEFARVRHHLILLAKNNEGYRNLMHLVSRSWLDGFHYKPRVDKKMLVGHTDGLIALSACIAGEIPRTLMGTNKLITGGGTFDDAIQSAREYASLFPDRFYLEVQANSLPEQGPVNRKLLELAEATKLPLVATNDCHYLNAEDVEAHDLLLCIQTQAKVDDAKRLRFDAKDLYYKSEEEMRAGLDGIPEEALQNTMKIADQCSGLEMQLHAPPYHFPIYELPEGMTLESEFCRMAREGLKKRLAVHPHRDSIDHQAYWDRLEMELKVICDMGFPGYFLIVQDYINWAKNNDIPVGPGRGSAAGSVVAWALRITSIDPLPNHLFFERFLNIERVSMPDIDVDFCEDRRLEVLDYVTRKYGKDKVSQIAAFGKMKAKAVVKDVGRAMGIPFNETTRIAKMIPADTKMTLQKALETVPELAEEYKNDPQVRKLIDVSRRLEGLTRHASTHAAGVVVSDKPMEEYLPLFAGRKGEQIAEFDMKFVEKVGLVKFDFLGLRTMTVISNAVKNIQLQGKQAPDMENLATDDPGIYELLSRGDTDGVFQLESSGMRNYLRMLKPSGFEDLVAMLALYRPGPLRTGMVVEFIKRKHGEIKVTYPLPELESCLKDTYGVIVYQEQVMQIAQITAQYTLGGADLLRRAMGKKKPEEMAKQRSIFMKGASERNVPEKVAGEIFDLMEKFAEYGFNKAHSAAYAYITYETAYLKYYFKVEYMAALLTSEIGNQDKILKYIAACGDMNIKVLPPDVQVSLRSFTPKGEVIVYGLGGVKNVGDEAINEIVRAREADGPYASLLDLCCRVNLRKVSKRVIESLIKGGACDCFGVSRAGMLASLDNVVNRAQKKQKEKTSAQISLFSLAPAAQSAPVPGIGFPCEEQDIQEWDDDQKLAFEKDALGFYLTSHPLQPFRRDMLRLGLMPLEEVGERRSGQIKTGVLVTSVKELVTKRGERMAFVQVEDLTGHAEVTIFPKTYGSIKEILHAERPLIELTATIDSDNAPETDDDGDEETNAKEIKLRCDSARPLMDACMDSSQSVIIPYPVECTHEADIEEFKAILDKYKGPSSVLIQFTLNGHICIMELGPRWKVQPGPLLNKDMEAWAKAHSAVTPS